MGWAVGYDRFWERDVGYGVPAVCDHPDCDAGIHRGLSYVCGGKPYGGDDGCGLFFCLHHGGGGLDCDHVFQDEPGFQPSPDTAKWTLHKLTDSSWQKWRDENPDAVEVMCDELRGEA